MTSHSLKNKTAATLESYLSRVKALLPAIRERAAQTEKLRRIPDESFNELRKAGLFRALQPKRFGGYEFAPRTFFEAVIELGTACGSTSWVAGVLGIHNWQLGLFDPKAQDDVWGEDPNVLIVSSIAPTGTIERVDEGFRLNGRWTFASGCDFCQWAILGGLVPSLKEGVPPQRRMFLVPRSDYVIDDDWNVMGLCGTGSKGIVVKDAFVPDYRSLSFLDVFDIKSPGLKVNTGPLYRLPLGFIFPHHIASSALGVALGAVNHFYEGAKGRIWARERTRVAEDPFVQVRLAEAVVSVDTARRRMLQCLDEMMVLARAAKPIPLEQRARFRWYTAHVVGLSVQAVDRIFEVGGAHAIFLDNPLQRAFRDIHVMRQHPGANQEKIATIFGRSEFGLPPVDLIF